MSTETAPTQEASKAKKSAPRAAAPAPSPVLGISPTASPAEVDAAYKSRAAKVQAEHTAKTNIAQRDAASEVQAHHRDHEEKRKALKKNRTQFLRDAQKTKVLSLRAVQSAFDVRVSEVETEHTKGVTDASHAFNDAVAPIHKLLNERKAVIDSEAKGALSEAQAEFSVEKAKAEERVRAAKVKSELEAAKIEMAIGVGDKEAAE